MKRLVLALAFLAFAFPAAAEDIDPDTGVANTHRYLDVCLSVTGTPA